MSCTYKNMDEVPTKILAERLSELSDSVTKGSDSVSREFTMSIPAEMDRDADLVLAGSAVRLIELQAQNAKLQQERDGSLIILNGLKRRIRDSFKHFPDLEMFEDLSCLLNLRSSAVKLENHNLEQQVKGVEDIKNLLDGADWEDSELQIYLYCHISALKLRQPSKEEQANDYQK